MTAPLKDLTGQRFGRLTVVKRAGTYYPPCWNETKLGSMPTWECLCDCGRTTVVTGGGLVRGNTRSCGCLRRENGARLGRAQKGRHWKKRKKEARNG